MTQEELANVIGVSSQSISKWENNTTMPDILLLPIIAEIFEVTLDELFSIEKNQKTKRIPMEETPLAVYDAVLDTMWAGQEADIKKIKGSLSNDPDQHTGFVSMQRGVYADRIWPWSISRIPMPRQSCLAGKTQLIFYICLPIRMCVKL